MPHCTCRCALRAVVALMLVAQHAAVADAQQDTTSTLRGASRGTASDSTTPRALKPVKVIGRVDDLRGYATTASQGHVGAADLRLRPLMREGELLESVPGLIVTQHSGDGKANQLFVRGFNLDHGTDFSTRVEGMPVNMPTHAHGQGYTDLNFIIPEFVDFIDYRLGNSHTTIGDFGSAGGAEFQLVRALDRPFLSLGTGAFGHARVVGGASLSVGTGSLLLGGETERYSGPWQVNERLRKYSGLARYSRRNGSSHLSLLALAYRNTWDATDQIPLRAVRSGELGRFGQVDPTLGGASSRHSLSATWDHIGRASTQQLQLYGIASSLDLYSNFTYRLDDERLGDQFNQREHRLALGGNASHKQSHTALGTDHLVTLGAQLRLDRIDDIGLHRTHARVRTGTVRQDDVTELGTGLYVEAESRWHPRLRTTLGLRGDAYAFDVSSQLATNSGRRTAAIVSPKLSLAFEATRRSELYLSAGTGFHSNDARGTTITVDPNTGDSATRVDPLVRSVGGEVGLRWSPASSWRTTLALWALDLESELLFVGDGGTTEPTDGSRRAGITLANFWRPVPALALDADISFARARLRDVAPGEDRIPGALERVVAAGATYSTPSERAFLSLRLRHFGAYPLIESNRVRAEGTTLVNATSGLRFVGLRVQLSVLNLLGSRASDIQYFYASRLAGEPAGGVADIHFHPVEPRQLRLGLERRF